MDVASSEWVGRYGWPLLVVLRPSERRQLAERERLRRRGVGTHLALHGAMDTNTLLIIVLLVLLLGGGGFYFRGRR